MRSNIYRRRWVQVASGMALLAAMQPAAPAKAQSLFGLQNGNSNSGLNSFATPSPGVPTSGTSNPEQINTPSGAGVTPQPNTPYGQNPQTYNSVSAPNAIGAFGGSAQPLVMPGQPSEPPQSYTPMQNTSAFGAAAATNPVSTAQTSMPSLNAATQSTTQLQPFGANLFINPAPPSNLAPNPNYVVQPGDTVIIQVYGGMTSQSTSVVDTEGNVFLPGFGPVHVAGVTAASLQATVQNEISHAFTSNISVYAVLQSENPISVYVTGFVRAPGQYLGSASDSVLDFLSRAGGVDPSRGSYRDIEVLRGGQVLDDVDLYDFLLDGTQLPSMLRDGDTILVGKQEPMVAVGGSVRNNYLFEVPDSVTAGQDIINFAEPLSSATNVLLNGSRGGQPFSQYLSISQLSQTPLYDQDQLTFVADSPAPTITVQVEGSRIGPSVLVANRDTTLKTVLDYIAVDPRDADTKSIYIIRPGLAAQQYDAIQAALDRLQKALYFATSVTTGEAQIRASEATQVQNYINYAKTVQPDGILVVADDRGNLSDVRLENGDIITIPESSDTVMVDGEVQSPQAVDYSAAATRADYINLAGGTTERGKKANTIIRRLSGRLVLDPNAPVMPGDELIVLPYVESQDFVVTQDVLSLLYQVAASTYFASKL